MVRWLIARQSVCGPRSGAFLKCKRSESEDTSVLRNGFRTGGGADGKGSSQAEKSVIVHHKAKMPPLLIGQRDGHATIALVLLHRF